MVAAGLARGLAQRGQKVQLIRSGSSEAAVADAHAFAEYLFATAAADPVAREAISALADHLAIVELDSGEPPLQAPAIVVVRVAPDDDDVALAQSLGNRLIGTIAGLVPSRESQAVTGALTAAGLRPLAVLPEDHALAAPSVADIRHALAADVLYEGENLREPIQSLLVAPVYTDGAKVHFRRYPGAKAVLTPSYKTDLLLAGIEGGAACVIVTGGHQPSHYVIDRAQGEPTTILLAQHQTPAAVAALSDVWTHSAFAGEAKAEAALALLESRLDWDALTRGLASSE